MMKYKKQALKLQQIMIGNELEEYIKAKKNKNLKQLMHPETYYEKLAYVWDYLEKSMLYLESADRAACANNKKIDN